MTTDIILIQEILRAKMINAKREKEGAAVGDWLHGIWEGQEMAFRQMLDIVTKALGE